MATPEEGSELEKEIQARLLTCELDNRNRAEEYWKEYDRKAKELFIFENPMLSLYE